MNTTGTDTALDQYAAGLDAARRCIEVLSQTMTHEALTEIAKANIIPVYDRDADDYRYGTSDAWGQLLNIDWRARKAAAARRRWAQR